LTISHELAEAEWLVLVKRGFKSLDILSQEQHPESFIPAFSTTSPRQDNLIHYSVVVTPRQNPRDRFWKQIFRILGRPFVNYPKFQWLDVKSMVPKSFVKINPVVQNHCSTQPSRLGDDLCRNFPVGLPPGRNNDGVCPRKTFLHTDFGSPREDLVKYGSRRSCGRKPCLCSEFGHEVCDNLRSSSVMAHD
jgi:hypothetical protein